MSHVLRYKLLEILKGDYWLNSLQLCRILNGAKNKHDIAFCRDSPHAYSYENNFTGYGGNPYVNCKTCKVNRSRVYSCLRQIEKEDKIDSILGWFTDTLRKGKDKMRIWALKGKITRITNFVKETNR